MSRCLAEPVDTTCAIQYDMRLLVTVVAANLVKVIAMVATLLQYKMPALVTMGDGIASLLKRPDDTTKGMCLMTKADFESKFWESKPRIYTQDGRNQRRSFGVSRQQRAVSTGM